MKKYDYYACSARAAVAVSGAICAMMAGSLAYAQGSAEGVEAQGIGDIIVTAQKRSERLRDVPISITAATGDELKARGIESTDDLGKIAPGFTFTKNNVGLPIYFLRGVGFFDQTLGVSPAVTVYVDQTPLAYSPMSRGAMLDLERVEVLKGPQGTLFGQNSTGGAINYIAAKPTDHLEGGFDLTGGRFNQVNAEAFLSGPIAEELNARIAVRNEYQGAWQYNYFTGQKNGERRFVNGRLSLDWKPSERARFAFTASAWKDTSEAQMAQLSLYTPLRSVAAGGRPPGFPITTFPTAPKNNRAASWGPEDDLDLNNRFYQFALRGDVDLTDDITATSVTSYAKYKTRVPFDLDASPYPMSSSITNGSIKSFSQELRLSGEAGSVKWMVGGNYQSDVTSERFFSDGASSSKRVGPFFYEGYFIDNLQKIKTYSGFGSIDVPLADKLTFQGSGRYTTQDRDYAGCARDDGTGGIARAFSFAASNRTGRTITIPVGGCVTLDSTGTPVTIATGTLDEDNWSWRGSLNYKPNNDTLVYASLTKGYKSGSFPTLPAVNVGQIQPVPQESILAYEAGVKTGIDRVLQIEGAGFYYDYKDKQLVGFRNIVGFGALPGLVTIPKSRVWGAELSALVRPVRGLTLNLGGTYVNTKVKSNPVNPTGPYPEYTTGPVSFVGQSFPFSPRWQGVADLQYSFAVAGNKEAFFGASVTSRSSTNGSLFTGQASAAPYERLIHIDGYSLVDLRAGLSINDDATRIELFSRNIFDKFYVTNANRANDSTFRFTGSPATYGVSIKYRFGK